jgi:hypothetical protein
VAQDNSSDKPWLGRMTAKLLAEIMALGHDQPWKIERAQKLFDADPRDRLVQRWLQAILPAKIDEEAVLAILEGRAEAPVRQRFVDPDKGRQPKARGSFESLQAALARSAADVAGLEEKLRSAKQQESTLREQVAEADALLRLTVFGRVLAHASDAFAGPLIFGPLWTLVRAVSGYLKVDFAYESALDTAARAELEAHRKSRRDTAAEIVGLLDRYCGDIRVEVALHNAILSVLRNRHDPVAREIERRSYSNEPMSADARRPSRSNDERRAAVRAGAIISDRTDVLRGIPASDRSAQAGSVNSIHNNEEK